MSQKLVLQGKIEKNVWKTNHYRNRLISINILFFRKNLFPIYKKKLSKTTINNGFYFNQKIYLTSLVEDTKSLFLLSYFSKTPYVKFTYFNYNTMGYRHYPQYTWIRRRSGFRRLFSWAEVGGCCCSDLEKSCLTNLILYKTSFCARCCPWN